MPPPSPADGIFLLAPILLFLLHTSVAQRDSPVPDQTPATNQYAQNFNPSMAIIMVVLFSALFIIGFFSVYLQRCEERRFRRRSSDLQLQGGQLLFGRGLAVHGIDASVMQSFPKFQYSLVKGLKIGKGSLECAVCLNEFEEDDVLRLLPRCSHVFHSNCIDEWLSSHTTCPVCRANLVPKPDEKIEAPLVPQVGDPEPSRCSSCPPDQMINSKLQSPQAEEGTASTSKVIQSPRTGLTGMRFGRLLMFPRSHSTGHSLVQLGEDCERFTLRLPGHVRDQIMKSAPSQSQEKSGPALPRARSAKAGYRRSGSSGGWRNYGYGRFDQEEGTSRWWFGMSRTPPFIANVSSFRSVRGLGRGDGARMSPTMTPPKTVRSPLFDRLFLGVGRDDGERSSHKMRPHDYYQV
ncbi:hypothetical protein SAY86_003584 [Trapa natans]|uniref:RING-type E3 ubiquitin transferase n=1 Tax=Trapa natans TaxID=22666 RepID=A0AAN7MSE8_TRANT|nr:hypothetical protein SAY86_003584 [Trapa natans]